jgi:hypothetical protein
MGIGLVTNISATGAFLETQAALRLLSIVYLEPSDPDLAHSALGRIAATVVRRGATGVGLKWYEFAADTTRVYARLLADASEASDNHQLPLPSMPDSPVGAAVR